MSVYPDRREAGRVLASALMAYAARPNLAVLALPRGGVPVGYEVALALGAPLDVFVVRKLGVPGHEELAMGAIASGGLCVLNHDVLDRVHVPPTQITRVAKNEMRELLRRENAYRGAHPRTNVAGRTVILVDDGLATGSTMRAAVLALRELRPERIVAAVPVAAPDACAELAQLADDMVCAATPEPFHAVGAWYEDFSQTTDQEVRALLAAARASEGEFDAPTQNVSVSRA
jgi:putative phosphoribosyl transferase